MKKPGIKITLPIVILVLMLFSQGCRKSDVEPAAGEPKNMFELTVSPSFDWKTTRDITLNISGLSLPVTIKNTLFVKSVDGNSVFYTDQIEMNKNYSFRVTVPASLKQLVVSYGSISRTYEISGNTIDFDYLLQ